MQGSAPSSYNLYPPRQRESQMKENNKRRAEARSTVKHVTAEKAMKRKMKNFYLETIHHGGRDVCGCVEYIHEKHSSYHNVVSVKPKNTL